MYLQATATATASTTATPEAPPAKCCFITMVILLSHILLRSVFRISCFFCGLDPGNLKFETVQTNTQHLLLGFETLNLKLCDLKF